MAKVEMTIDLAPVHCPWCGVVFWVPAEYRKNREGDHRGIYCPNGHPLHFPGETEVERLTKLLVQKDANLQELEKKVARLKTKPRKKAS